MKQAKTSANRKKSPSMPPVTVPIAYREDMPTNRAGLKVTDINSRTGIATFTLEGLPGIEFITDQGNLTQ